MAMDGLTAMRTKTKEEILETVLVLNPDGTAFYRCTCCHSKVSNTFKQEETHDEPTPQDLPTPW